MSEKFGAMKHIGLMSAGRTRSREEWREVHKHWRTSNAEGWLEQAWRVGEQVREGRMGRQLETLKQEMEAMREIMWRAAENGWFEYSLGSQTLVFPVPEKIQATGAGRSEGVVCEEGPHKQGTATLT
jgi:predicted deacylase